MRKRVGVVNNSPSDRICHQIVMNPVKLKDKGRYFETLLRKERDAKVRCYEDSQESFIVTITISYVMQYFRTQLFLIFCEGKMLSSYG